MMLRSIAAAASLRYALDEIAKRYEKETGKSVKITYGATGNLVHQIENAAPFQVLFAADDESVNKLAKGGFTEGKPVVFARGQLSLVAPKGSPVTVDADLKGLKEALAAGKVKHVSIANPDVAPYGRAAREALQKAGLWEQVQPLLVIGENVGQAAQFVSTGAAEAGLIAQSLAISADLAPKIDLGRRPRGLARAHRSWHGAGQRGFAKTPRPSPNSCAGRTGRAVLETSGFSVPTS